MKFWLYVFATLLCLVGAVVSFVGVLAGGPSCVIFFISLFLFCVMGVGTLGEVERNLYD